MAVRPRARPDRICVIWGLQIFAFERVSCWHGCVILKKKKGIGCCTSLLPTGLLSGVVALFLPYADHGIGPGRGRQLLGVLLSPCDYKIPQIALNVNTFFAIC